MVDLVYDIEVLPNVFTCTFINVKSRKVYVFEISPRKNDITRFVKFINMLKLKKCRMIGFNNMHYDYPVIHYILTVLRGYTSAKQLTHHIYNKSQAIFRDSKHNPFAHSLWDNQCLVEQIDLYKIYHFDNKAKTTSLKRLEFNMRLDNVQEFEIPFDKPVKKSSVIRSLLGYNLHDCVATLQFWLYSMSQVRFREDLSTKYGRSVMNYNDTRIGEDYVINQIKERIGDDVLYTTGDDGKRKKKGTNRTVMDIKDFIFDYIKFDRPEFQSVLDEMLSRKMFVIKGKFYWHQSLKYPEKTKEIKTLTGELKKHESDPVKKDQIKNKLKDLKAKYTEEKFINLEADGVEFVYGKGGVHATLRDTICYTTKDRIILDLDVTSFYTVLGIVNNLYPEHLTKSFCPIYSDVFQMRRKHKKGTVENGMLKLALNGAYGKTNSNYSSLYDPLYTVSTTLNGQLLLTMLWEKLSEIKNIKLIQINTDGVTIEIDKTQSTKQQVKDVCKDWEKLTKLQLESAVYTRMWIRDGNNYIAEYKGGKLKNKGDYKYDALFHSHDQDASGVEWHKDHSMIIVKKAVEAELVHGIPVRKFIIEHDDIYDFFLNTNLNRGSRLMLGDGYIPAEKYKGKTIAPAQLGFLNEEIQRVSRYIISNSSDQLTKVMPPYKGIGGDRYFSINSGYNVSVYNQVKSKNISDYDINYQFYIDEAEKLLNPFRGK